MPLYEGHFLRGSGSRVAGTVTLQHGFLDRNFRSRFLQLLLKLLDLSLQFADSRLLLDAQAVNLGCDDGALLWLSDMSCEWMLLRGPGRRKEHRTTRLLQLMLLMCGLLLYLLAGSCRRR